MTQKKALITGITGQDGAYLAEYLIKKGYIVHGIKRRASSFNTERIDHLYQDPHVNNRNLILHYGDLTDSMNLTRIIHEVQPDEIYNLAAMSHVKVSFDTPEYTANADGLGMLRILEAVRLLGLVEKQEFIRRQHLNYMVMYRKFRKLKKHHFIHVLPMPLQKCMPIGLLLITAKHIRCMPVTGFCLTMNRQLGEKPLLHEKLHGQWLELL